MRTTPYPELELLVDGEWLGATHGERDTMAVHDPATGAVLGRLPLATAADIGRAIEAADRAFTRWREVTALERGRLLQRIAASIRDSANQLATLLTLEQGKTLAESLGEIGATADTFEWMAEEGKRAYGRVVPARFPGVEQLVVLEPVGPVGAFAPWNYPAVLAARKVATALAAGCTIVLKPAEETPGIFIAIARLCMAAGLPAGVLNVLYGVPAEISGQLIAAPQIKKLSFTGSVPVGRLLLRQAADAMKTITLELGGHAPVIVDRDVDVDRVVELAVAAKFRNAGQICHAPTRFIVHDAICDAFIQKFSTRARSLRVGNGLDPAVQMGPLINARRQQAMRDFTEQSAGAGATVVCGGRVPASGAGSDSGGFFWQPTVLADVPPAAAAIREEVFGPLALVTRFDQLDAALELANAVDFGLSAYAFTRSMETSQAIQHRLQAGSVSINTFAMTPPEMPFGGIKQSGIGVEMGCEGLLGHFNAKSVIRAATA